MGLVSVISGLVSVILGLVLIILIKVLVMIANEVLQAVFITIEILIYQLCLHLDWKAGEEQEHDANTSPPVKGVQKL